MSAESAHTGAASPPIDIGKIAPDWRLPIGRIVAVALIGSALYFVVHAFAYGQIDWAVTARFFTAPQILHGVLMTIVMTVCAKSLAVVIGVMAAVMLMSENIVLRGVAIFYVWLFRGMPILLQLLIWFNLALVFPAIGLPGVFSVRTVDVITPFIATLLGLGLNQGAYTAEVIRAGIVSVDRGQVEAGKAIGMTHFVLLRRIVFPQAMRVIIPPLGNETISMVKLTSVASVIQFAEVLRNAENIYFANARVIELLFVAAGWYLIIVTVLSIGQHFLEKRYSRAFGVNRKQLDRGPATAASLPGAA
jgi:polar amino acid transport system permease protein